MVCGIGKDNESGIMGDWQYKRRFNSYVDHMRRIYGGRVQKLTLDAGFTCPNRDGTKGNGGCTFCLNDAFNPSYCYKGKSVKHQLSEGIEFHNRRYRKAVCYIAYFQAFSNTYAPVEKLRKLYLEALTVEGVIGLVVGTRPDCIDVEKLELLKELSEYHYVMIEYGIESVYDKTLHRVNRGHTLNDAINAIQLTVEWGIPVGAHLVFGLPGETRKEMLKSVEIISRIPLSNIKFHQLQLFKGTEMESEFLEKPADFYIFTMEDYLDFMVEYISRLNPGFIVERIAGETPPRFATLRPWGPRYDNILIRFEKLLEERDTWQGKLFNPNN